MFSRLWDEYPGTILGLSIGILIGIIYLFVGLWKTIIFAGFIMLGIYVGRKFDHREDLKDMLEDILPDKFFKS